LTSLFSVWICLDVLRVLIALEIRLGRGPPYGTFPRIDLT
jgi:hypothetical protein